VETLAYFRSVPGERLAIITNGGGPGVLAVDALIESGGRLAVLTEDTLERLDAVLPRTWSRGNPVDIIGDASADRFRAATDILLAAPEADAILFAYAPTAMAEPSAIANAVVESMKGSRRPVFATWLGGRTMEAARARFASAGIPTYETPEKAVRAFRQLVEYRRNQAALMRTPPAAIKGAARDTAKARQIVETVLGEGRTLLTEPEAKDVLAAYGLEVVRTRVARDEAEAARLARELGFPVALKLLSPDITHKSDVGGVVLDLATEDAVIEAGAAIRRRVKEARPEARFAGFTVQAMARMRDAHELILGATVDRTFGPVILFGHGGTATEVIADSAIALPPLDMSLARDLVDRTRVSRLLAGYRDRASADIDAICLALVRLSELVCDMAEICEVDVNPLLADPHRVIALDARMRIASAAGVDPIARLAIRPYPQDLEESAELAEGRLVLRPIRPDDEAAHRDFLAALDTRDIRFRFFGAMRDFSHETLARLTQIDYDREMAFIATDGKRTVGVVRAVTDPDNIRAEFAIVIAGDCQGKGLGRRLMQKMIAYARGRGTETLIGQVLADNARMLDLMRSLGFELRFAGDAVYEVALRLRPPSAS
jgi:acetyltransferase